VRQEAEEQSSEAQWWEESSDVPVRQWELTPMLSQVVRGQYLSHMKTRLHKPGGRLLEIGCGSGWAGMWIAGHDMDLTGIDPSPRLVARARLAAEKSGLSNARFLVGLVTDLDPEERYDAVLVHAVLHHLPLDEIGVLLAKARDMLIDGGVLYLYEPLQGRRPNSLLRMVSLPVSFVLWRPWALLRWLSGIFTPGSDASETVVRPGRNTHSPDERPLDGDWLCQEMSKYYLLQELRYWHAYSLAFAMSCSELPPQWASIVRLFASVLYRVDQRLLTGPLRDYVRGVWTLASLTATTRPIPHVGAVR
jgi:2-polyprenyl-3-methyl-5-hydroxy-6-metoxy-1,4-benzoquinol methylase